MAMTWAQHMQGVNGLLDAERARRTAARAAAQVPVAATAPPGSTAMPDLGQAMPETWQGGMNGGNIGGATAPGDMSSLAGGFGLNGQSIGGLLGALGGGLVGGPFGGLAGGLLGRGLGGLFGGGAAGMNMGDLSNDPKDMAMNSGLGLGDGLGLGGMDPGNQNDSKGDDGTMNGWMRGGYTGAGRDGKVQPHMPAGTVHEGELVIPHHMVRRMIRGLLG